MIEVSGINKSFENKKVLENYSERFETGITCLMGESGLGKTTLINIIAGIIKPDSGEVRGAEGKRINMVFQENRLMENLSAIRNVLFVCGKEGYRAAAITLLTTLGLEGSLTCPVSTLSGGMKRRVAIARALSHPADIYLFDEPFKELDEERKTSVMQIIKEKTADKVVIIVTHDASDADELGARIVTMERK